MGGLDVCCIFSRIHAGRGLITAARQYIIWETLAFYASLAAALLGAVALLLVGLRWSWLSQYYREFWAKCAVALFRAMAAISAIVAKSTAPESELPLLDQPWTSTVFVAILGYLLWEVVGAIGDHKSKLADANHKRTIEELNSEHEESLALVKQDREDAVLGALRLNWLLTHIYKGVSGKHQRILRTMQVNADTRRSLQQAREGFSPNDQIHHLLELLTSLFHYEAVHHDRNRFNQNFRAGFFVERKGRLEPLSAFELRTYSHDPFSSYIQHADRYRLNNDVNPSHAVRCVREGRTIIVPDCLKEPGFKFFNERQRSYLRSMVAHPLAGFRLDGTTPVSAALLVDTDVEGFFSEDDREMLEQRLREFAARISLEYAIGELIGFPMDPRGGGDD